MSSHDICFVRLGPCTNKDLNIQKHGVLTHTSTCIECVSHIHPRKTYAIFVLILCAADSFGFADGNRCTVYTEHISIENASVFFTPLLIDITYTPAEIANNLLAAFYLKIR